MLAHFKVLSDIKGQSHDRKHAKKTWEPLPGLEKNKIAAEMGDAVRHLASL